MRILHIGLASLFTPGMSYQDNFLSQQNVKDGQTVMYISDAHKYEDGIVVETGYEDQILPDGMRLVRLPYVHIINRFVSDKARMVKGLENLIEEFSPDVILSHGLGYWSVLDVIRYKKKHPKVKLYADTHAAADNSGTNWLSLHVLHRGYYRWLTQKALPYLEKYWYVGADERTFAIENFRVPESVMEFYPLGGIVQEREAIAQKRQARRQELNIGEGELLLVHAGKLEPKKKTEMLLRAFATVPELNAKLAVIGSIPEEQKDRLTEQMAADSRVVYLGWKSGDELQEYLCAADMYVQPGKVSAIMQNAVCCHCPVITYPHTPYTQDYDFGNLIWISNEEELTAVLRKLARGEYDLEIMRKRSETCARELFDYRALAARLYQ